MNEDMEHDLLITEQVMRDKRELPVVIRIMETWVLISGLQLLTRHPDLSPQLLKLYEEVGREFQRAIVAVHPEAEALIEKGWHTEFDVRRDDS